MNSRTGDREKRGELSIATKRSNENKMSHAAVDGVGCKLRVELGKR